MRRIGHRGGMGHAPQNSVAAFEKAIALGCDEVETDVWIAPDGRLVISHDRPTDRVSLTLDAALDLCRGRVGVNVELKCEGDESRAAETGARVARRLAERSDPDAYVSSFWWGALTAARASAPTVRRAFVFSDSPDRDALIVDVRVNGGGHVSGLLLEKLARKRVGYDFPRWAAPKPYPDESPAGPMVALTNELAGSDGDIFSHTFKMLKLGPLVGKRTWGGVLAPLVDFLAANGLGQGSGSPSVQPVGDGHSNVTYALEHAGRELIVRRPPRGPATPCSSSVSSPRCWVTRVASTPRCRSFAPRPAPAIARSSTSSW